MSEEQLAKAEEALKPFASVALLMAPLCAGWPDDKPNSEFIPGAWPNWADFKRANETLTLLQSPTTEVAEMPRVLAGMIEAEKERIIQAAIERAEQACRYVLKHQNFEGESEYQDGFEIACEVCEKAIAEHVRRHIEADLARPDDSPDDNPAKA